MSKIRLILLTAMAMVTFSVASTATASATECTKEANKKFVLCLGVPPVLTVGTKTFHIFEATKNYVIKTANVTINCAEVLLTKEPVITGSATSVKLNKVILHFVSCTVPAPPNCRILNGLIITLSLEGTIKTKELVLLFPEEAGNIHFATITTENSGGTCVIAGKLNLVTEKGNHEEGPLFKALGLEITGTKQSLFLPGTTATTGLKLDEESATLAGELFGQVLDESGVAIKWSVVEGK